MSDQSPFPALHLTPGDYGVMAGGAVIALVLGGLSVAYPAVARAVSLIAPIPVIMLGIGIVWMVVYRWEGGIGRAFLVAGTGFTATLLVWLPHALWHNAYMAWDGLSAGAWAGLLHGTTVSGGLLVMYGFYLLFLESRELRKPLPAPPIRFIWRRRLIIGGILLLPIIFAVFLAPIDEVSLLVGFDRIARYVGAFAYLIGLVYLVKARRSNIGGVNRGLELLIIAFTVSLLVIPYAWWHLQMGGGLFGPAMLGLPAHWWGTVFPVALVWAYSLMVYGFYFIAEAEKAVVPS